MEEVTLQAAKRAMPGHGRARIHTSLLTTLGIDDNDEVEVAASGGASVILTVFADSLVDKRQIRISEEDLRKLGISDGDTITVRRKIPIGEQVKTAAAGITDKMSRGMKDLGDSVAGKTSDLKDGTIQAAQDISSRAKEVSEKIVDQVSPIGEKICETGKETVAKIQDLVPTSRFNKVVESGLQELSADDASELKKVLLQSKDDIHAAIVKEAAAGRVIGNLTVPPDIVIIAVQRDGTRITPAPDLALCAGDLVYMTGSLSGLDYMTTVLEGE